MSVPAAMPEPLPVAEPTDVRRRYRAIIRAASTATIVATRGAQIA